MNGKLKLLGLALGVAALLALGLGGAVMAADGRDRGANCGNCLEGAVLEGSNCPRLNGEGCGDLGTCPRWGEDADRVCPNEDGECDGTGCLANEGEVTRAGNCWRGAQAERSCFEAGENIADGSGCMRGGR